MNSDQHEPETHGETVHVMTINSFVRQIKLQAVQQNPRVRPAAGQAEELLDA
jgi:hypothetical protein